MSAELRLRTVQPKGVPFVVRLWALLVIVGPLAIACTERTPTQSLVTLHVRLVNQCGGPCCDSPDTHCTDMDSLPPIPLTPFAVRCFPPALERGGHVRCWAYFGQPRPLTVITRNAKGTGFSLQNRDTISVPVDTLHFLWAGEAVASSAITVRVQYRDSLNQLQRVSGSGSFVVNPRFAADPTLLQPRVVEDSLVGMTDYPYHKISADSSEAIFGSYLGPLGDAGTSVNSFNTGAGTPSVVRTVDDGGPNAGLTYWRVWPTIADSSISRIHPALSGGRAFPGATHWYDQQTGPQPAKCSQSEGVVILHTETERHEGVTMVSDSHFGVGLALIQASSIAVNMERMYHRDSSKMVQNTNDFIDKVNKKYRKQQADYDFTDKRLIFGRQAPHSSNLGRIGCHIVIDTAFTGPAPGPQ